jgi:hypothetical protein
MILYFLTPLALLFFTATVAYLTLGGASLGRSYAVKFFSAMILIPTTAFTIITLL